MLVVMANSASAHQVERVVDTIRDMGYQARPIPGKQRSAIGLVGNDGKVDSARLEALPGVLEVIHVTQPHKQVSREWYAETTIIELENGTRIGGEQLVFMAGPCSVESRDQILGSRSDARYGCHRTARGSFQATHLTLRVPRSWCEGAGIAGRRPSSDGLAIVTEALETDTVTVVAEYADISQIGARNMQNYPLLSRAEKTGKPILLKRGLSATIKELLLSAEYLLAEGNPNVVFCERGIRNLDDHTPNLLDLTAIPVVQSLSHLPIIPDPSHGTGVRAKVLPMARAAIAAGAYGLMIEVYPNPDQARSDGAQSLWPDQFEQLVAQIAVIAETTSTRAAPAAVRV